MTEKRVGLLFVHGIGQQQPFDFLRSSVAEIAELMGRDKGTSCAVNDRTANWKKPVGSVTTQSAAPITLTVKRNGGKPDSETTIFECHEVYWADLGARAGLFDTIAFWFWGLGQWCAPVYRDLDAAQLRKVAQQVDGSATDRPVSQIARLPQSFAGFFWREVFSRFLLALSGLGALLTLVSWSLIKRIASAIVGNQPGPSLLVQYVGDVRTYEERARPGDTALSDPGFPRRVGIRRRMVTQMVGLGARRDLDRWYVVAHSLGTVVAYNGLTEIGHTLPNYLDEAQWLSLPPAMRRDPECLKRDVEAMPFMMPARPAWLEYDDVIDRKALFGKLAGILTYGSALGKFGGIWPRVVATATDRKVPDATKLAVDPNKATRDYSAFPKNCRWINLHAPQDPVAGPLRSFGAWCDGQRPDPKIEVPFCEFIPKIKSFTTPFWQPFLLSHLLYFKNGEAYSTSKGLAQRQEAVKLLLGEKPKLLRFSGCARGKGLGALFFGSLIVALLCALTIGIVTAGGGIGWNLLLGEGPAWKRLRDFFVQFGRCAAPVTAIALWILLIAGVLRWIMESGFNWKSIAATAGGAGAVRRQNESPDKAVRLNRLQLAASIVTGVVVAAIGAATIACALIAPDALRLAIPVVPPGGADPELPVFVLLLALAPVLGLFAASVQALVNKLLLGPVRSRRAPRKAR